MSKKIVTLALLIGAAIATGAAMSVAEGALVKVVSGERYRLTLRAVGLPFDDDLIGKVKTAIEQYDDQVESVVPSPDRSVLVMLVTYHRDTSLHLDTLAPKPDDPGRGIYIQNVEPL